MVAMIIAPSLKFSCPRDIKQKVSKLRKGSKLQNPVDAGGQKF
jgi:hypothetical protein